MDIIHWPVSLFMTAHFNGDTIMNYTGGVMDNTQNDIDGFGDVFIKTKIN